MSLFRISSLLALSAAAISGALLFWTSQSVQQEETRLRALEKAYRSEERAIRVLSAEWDYLNRPDRIEALARKYLNMTAPGAGGMVDDPASLPAVRTDGVPGGAQPVSFGSAQKKSIPVPSSKPSISLPVTKERDFGAVLDTLTKQEGAP